MSERALFYCHININVRIRLEWGINFIGSAPYKIDVRLMSSFRHQAFSFAQQGSPPRRVPGSKRYESDSSKEGVWRPITCGNMEWKIPRWIPGAEVASLMVAKEGVWRPITCGNMEWKIPRLEQRRRAHNGVAGRCGRVVYNEFLVLRINQTPSLHDSRVAKSCNWVFIITI